MKPNPKPETFQCLVFRCQGIRHRAWGMGRRVKAHKKPGKDDLSIQEFGKSETKHKTLNTLMTFNPKSLPSGILAR
jgi:hypothetical protein